MKLSHVQFIDLAAQQKVIYPGLEGRIRRVLSHGKYIMGPEVFEFEEKLAGYLGVKHAISCASGTDALLMCLMAYGVGPGDAVFTTPFTFIATAEVIALLGATPVFVDIDSNTFNIDPSKLKLAINALKEDRPKAHPLPKNENLSPERNSPKMKPRGVIAVDLFGLPADYRAINEIAMEHGLFVIEDAAQSLGASFNGKRAGALAHSGATSFFPAKPLGCYGDGGAVFTDDDHLSDILQSIRLHGKGGDKYDNVRIGINGRLDTLQAAILLEKLTIFAEEIAERDRVASRYSQGLNGFVQTPVVPDEYTSAWAQYCILSAKRDPVQAALKEQAVPTAIYYPKPLHLQKAFSYLGYQAGDFPVSEKTSHTILGLPMHPYLKNEEIDQIVDIVVNSVSS